MLKHVRAFRHHSCIHRLGIITGQLSKIQHYPKPKWATPGHELVLYSNLIMAADIGTAGSWKNCGGPACLCTRGTLRYLVNTAFMIAFIVNLANSASSFWSKGSSRGKTRISQIPTRLYLRTPRGVASVELLYTTYLSLTIMHT